MPDRLDDLIKAGVRSITITINAVTTEIAEKVYSWVYYKGKRYIGREAAELIVKNQARGLRNVIDAGLIVKVNTVYIPGINDAEIPLIAWLSGQRGVDIMNIIPLIPQAELSHIQKPSSEMIKRMREDCEGHIPQMTHCRQCRADAFGILGEDRDMVA